MSRYLFVIQNGIGFGHLRRALLLAQGIERSSTEDRCFIVCQASSTDLLEGRGIPALTLPGLHRLPDQESVTAYRAVLEEVLNAFAPDVLIEDTHPLLPLRHIAGCSSLKRILLIRRLTPRGLEEMRHYGELGWYDCIIYMDAVEPGDTACFGGPLHTLFSLSGRFSIVSPLAAEVEPHEVEIVRARYRRAGERLVVVSCGAGGEHGENDSAERLYFQAYGALQVLIKRGERQHWVFVTGPYYRGRQLEPVPQATHVCFEPHLPALLQESDVVIARPGFNVTQETLRGRARLILIPGPSYHEGQTAWCEGLKHHPDVHTVAPGDVAALANAVGGELTLTSARRLPNGLDGVVAAVRKVARTEREMQAPAPGVHLVLLPDEIPAALSPFSSATCCAGFKASHLDGEGESALGGRASASLWWGEDVEGFSFEWLEARRPAVLLVDRSAIRPWELMARAFGFEAKGIMVHGATVVRGSDFVAEPNRLLDGLFETAGPEIFALKGCRAALTVSAQTFFSEAARRGWRLLDQRDLLWLVAEASFLSDAPEREVSS